MGRGRHTVAGLAAAAVFLLGACSGDDDEEGSGSATTTDPSEQETTTSAGDAAGDGEVAADDEAFCEWFTSVGPVATEWDPQEAASMTPPAEIAEEFGRIVDGSSSLSDESAVTRWATDNCF